MRQFAEAKQLMQDPGTKVISVDVFDTLLLRDTTPESTRFKKVSYLQTKALSGLLGSICSAADFYYLRQEAARTVYMTKRPLFGAREAHWTEIMGLVFSAMGVPATHETFELCARVELDYECTRLAINDDLLKLLDDAQNEGKLVFCVSDMYLGADQIGELLTAAAGKDLGFPIYSSADHGFGKGCGEMFRKLSAETKVDFCNILHLGDNRHVDYHVPRSLGIIALHTPRPMWWRMTRKYREILSWWKHPLP